ncbi:hypothetical protein [Halpernia frigidisoli]|uniref:Uncharacterized protein n=1 Tax=Halpernia frigidisoli TaxID=1125876 RepID=A0A1I3INS5_9FLAO|nr:hypothetical protein [Halpernia frigidisoli]SFI49621.1 hypothetical protein SAMN05443292_2714 [Halpernia frigidisoli]
MIEAIKHYAVNWVDGMKISREHLVQQENFILDSVRDANSVKINAFNYGLLPFSDSYGDKRIFEIQSTATNDAQLIIKKLSAVTMSGHRIEISDFKVNIRSLAKDMPADNNESNGDYYILASVNPFDKVSFGEINSEEIPPRHPFTKANSKIELIDTALLINGYSGGNYIILGKVTIKSGIAQVDERFIPPCTSLESHPKLVEYYNQYSHSMSNLRIYAFKILQKVAHKNQNDELAFNVKTVCKTVVNHISENYFSFKNIVYNQPPIFMMNVFSKLALHLYNDTQMMIPAELEEMLNYSLEWSEVAPHTLLNQLSNVAEIDYVHHDTGEIFYNTQIMLKSLEQVLGKLSELDYIGQRKENVIVNEQQVKSTNDPKKGWSVLD